MTRRKRFTAVDAMVVVLILGVSAGLSMTAVLRVRQAADRTRCSNSLKQLVLALQNYNDVFLGKLPQFADQGGGAASGRGLMSLFGVLVPYLEGGRSPATSRTSRRRNTMPTPRPCSSSEINSPKRIPYPAAWPTAR